MKLKRLYLRYSLNLQKLKIKLKNLEAKDFQDAYIVVSRRLYRVIHLRNLVLFCLIFTIFVLSMFISSFKEIEAHYNKDKPLSGGTYSEGLLGKFSRLNPIYSQTNQNDEDAVSLIFSGLMKRGENRTLKTDMAEKWALSEDRKSYTFELKKGIKWHDGADFSADDVIFTVGLIQNPDARSSMYESWKGVIVEKTDKGEVKFTLKEADDSFLENTTLRILPKHILEKIPAASIQTVDFNTKPVGTGPFVFDSLTKESGKETLLMSLNNKYYDKKPYIEKIMIVGFLDGKELLSEYHKKNIKGIGNPTQEITQGLEDTKGTVLHEYTLPRYVAMFFNVENPFLKEKNLRTALNMTVDRKELITGAVNGEGVSEYQPIAQGLGSRPSSIPESKKDLGKAAETLKGANYVLEANKLKFEGKDVSLKIVTGDTSELEKTAEIVAGNINKLGIKTEIISVDMNTLQKEYIRPRNYDILIIGENLGIYPDLFSFWHSSQIADPGLNFSKYKDRKLDKYLEISRKSANADEKQKKLEEVQKVILEEVPAVYLYNPYYIFITSDKIKGVGDGKIGTPSDRLENIENWYINADRMRIDE